MTKELKLKTHIQILPVNALVFGEYQRPLQESRIKKMSQEFNEDLLGTIVVSRRDHRHYVIDGMHRVVLCRLKNINYIQAVIHVGLTEEEEAELFVRLNQSRKGVTKAEVFDAALVAKNPRALMIKDIVEKNDYKLGKATGNYTIAAYAALEFIVKKYGIEHLDRTLGLIKKIWFGQTQSTNAFLIKGVAAFIHIYQDENAYADAKFVKQLSRHTSLTIMAEAKTDQTTSNSDIKIMNTLIRHYNYKLTKQLQHKHFNS